jgi:hypothetical protein
MYHVWQDEDGLWIVVDVDFSVGYEFENELLARLVCGALNL